MQSPRVQSAFQKAMFLFDALFAAEVREHADRHEKQLRRLAAAAMAKDSANIKSIQRLILHSHSSKLACLIRVVTKEDKLTPEAIREMAEALDPWKDCGEPIDAWAEPKASGEGWRPICWFGVKRSALQTLVADVLATKHGNEPFDYLVKGKGAEAASDEIVDFIERGYRFFVLADIKNFFRSVQKAYVEEAMGLPKAVMRNSVLISPEAPLYLRKGVLLYSTIKAFDGAVRSGLPQGSRASQIIASLLLGPALTEISPAKRLVGHGDDIAIAVRNEKEAGALTNALDGVLQSHPAGPFRLKRCEVAHAGDGFNFLQDRHRWDEVDHAVHRRPSTNSYRRYRAEVMRLVHENEYAQAVRKIARYRYLWMKSFRRWPWNSHSKLLLYFTTMEAMIAGKKQAE